MLRFFSYLNSYRLSLLCFCVLAILLIPRIGDASLTQSQTFELTVTYQLSKPFNQTQIETLCSNLYSHLASSALYALSTTEGVPFSCKWVNDTEMTMTLYVQQNAVST